jgi:hypothetical protein
MFSSETGAVLWRTDPKDKRSPQPIYQMHLRGEKLFGLAPHPAQDFYFVCLEAKTGKHLFRTETHDYAGKPEVTLIPRQFGPHWVARVKDRQDFELRVMDAANGKNVARLHVKGIGSFGEYGRVSATVQGGVLALHGSQTLMLGSAGE